MTPYRRINPHWAISAAAMAAFVLYVPMPLLFASGLIWGLAVLCLAACVWAWRETICLQFACLPAARSQFASHQSSRQPVCGKTRALYSFCLACCLGATLGLLTRGRLDALSREPSWGLPAQAIVSLAGMITGDSRSVAGGLRSYQLQLRQSRTADDATATASGTVALLVRGGLAVPSGSPVLIMLRSVPSERLFVEQSDVYFGRPAAVSGQWRFVARRWLLDKISLAAGPQAGPLLEALLVGVRDKLDSDLIRLFQTAGCTHILALSGQHLGILTVLAGGLFALLTGRCCARPANCLFIAGFVFVTGAGPSILRAALMFWLGSLATLRDRPQASSVYLCQAFLLHLLFDPASSNSFSFMLSYCALSGLVLFAGSFEFVLRSRVPPVLAGALAASLAAFLATSPLVLLQTGSLQVAGPLTATLAGPLTAALLCTGLVSLCLVALIPGFALLTAPLCAFLERCLVLCMQFGSSVPPLTIAPGWPQAACLMGIALAGLVLYAATHGGYPFPTRLQFSKRTGSRAGQPGLCHAEEIRPELSG